MATATQTATGLFCVKCRHLDCAVQGPANMICRFCEDGVPCPIAQREQKAAKSKPEGRPPARRAPAATSPAVEAAKLCACGCGEPAKVGGLYKWGHKPKNGQPPAGMLDRLETANKG